jgi:hypothetical protein
VTGEDKHKTSLRSLRRTRSPCGCRFLVRRGQLRRPCASGARAVAPIARGGGPSYEDRCLLALKRPREPLEVMFGRACSGVHSAGPREGGGFEKRRVFGQR